MTLLWGSGPPEDVQGELESLIVRYPAASHAAKDAVRAMQTEYERLMEARHMSCLIRRARFHPSKSCAGNHVGAENISAASQNKATSDIPELDICASTVGTCTDRCNKGMLKMVSRAGSSDLCQSKCSEVEAEPTSAGQLQSSRQNAGLDDGGVPTGGDRAYFDRLRRRCMQEAAGQGGGREAALQLLATALPGKGLDDIRELDRRCCITSSVAPANGRRISFLDVNVSQIQHSQV